MLREIFLRMAMLLQKLIKLFFATIHGRNIEGTARFERVEDSLSYRPGLLQGEYIKEVSGYLYCKK